MSIVILLDSVRIQTFGSSDETVSTAFLHCVSLISISIQPLSPNVDINCMRYCVTFPTEQKYQFA